MNLEALGITKAELLEMAAQKLVDGFDSQGELYDAARRRIEDHVREAVESRVNDVVNEALTREMERIISETIHPVTIWGERIDKPTTIREQLAEQAKNFWETKVNKDGRAEHYGGTARAEWLLRKLMDEEFTKAIKGNAEVIVAEFKRAILQSSTAMVTEHINRLIK